MFAYMGTGHLSSGRVLRFQPPDTVRKTMWTWSGAMDAQRGWCVSIDGVENVLLARVYQNGSEPRRLPTWTDAAPSNTAERQIVI
jgi:hypothetical protein